MPPRSRRLAAVHKTSLPLEARNQISRRRVLTRARQNGPQPGAPHHFTQPESNPQHQKRGGNRESACQADHRPEVIQCRGKPSRLHGCPRCQQNPEATDQLNPGGQSLKNGAKRQPDRRSSRWVGRTIHRAKCVDDDRENPGESCDDCHCDESVRPFLRNVARRTAWPPTRLAGRNPRWRLRNQVAWG